MTDAPGPPRAREDRRQKMLANLDLSTPGLEIGPLYTPVAVKEECDVTYVDIHHAEGLREVYAAHPGTPLQDIREVDFALIAEGRTRSLAEATKSVSPFSWVIASHVIEHVPDVISWLADIAEILVDDGILSLAVPDRRYCFDARRPATTVGQMLLAHQHRDERPSVRAVFDHYHEAVEVTPTQAWEAGRPGRETTMFPLLMAQEVSEKAVAEELYTDCHVWLFTPRSLVRQLRVLFELGLLDFTVSHVIATDVNDMEFFVTLRRVPRGLDQEGRKQLLEDGFLLPMDNIAPAEHAIQVATPSDAGAPTAEVTAAGQPSPAPPPMLTLSEKELQVLRLKRRVMESGRHLLKRLRDR